MMTGKERMECILKRKKADRIGLYEHFWGDTHKKWSSLGHVKEDEPFGDHFDFDISEGGWLSMVADLDFKPEVIEETEETILTRDGNYAVLRRHKLHDSTPEHVDFLVKDFALWKEHVRPLLKPVERRINFEGYERSMKNAREKNRYFMWSGVNVFECMHPVCGHEIMLASMVLDPDWVRDMTQTYADLTIKLQKILFEKEGLPDGIWYYEDMGFKQRPFMSPRMYKDLIFPYHKQTIDYAHSLGLPVIMHSCGFVEPLLPGMIEAGIDCLQVIEVKAGMDLLRIYREHGDKIALMGGIDVRTLYTNDKNIIDKELESKIPIVKQGFGFVAHSDHSIPNTVDYETFRYYMAKALELGSYA